MTYYTSETYPLSDICPCLHQEQHPYYLAYCVCIEGLILFFNLGWPRSLWATGMALPGFIPMLSFDKSYSPFEMLVNMIYVVVINAFSTLSAVLAEVSKNKSPFLLAKVYPSSKVTSLSESRSTLLPTRMMVILE